MPIEIIQMILIILLAFIMTIDQNGPVILSYFPAIVGVFVGLIMGDMQTAMVIAGTFQLMALGIAQLGGSSVPNYGLATIVGGYVAIKTGQGIDVGLAIGLPVGMLGIQLDIVVKIINNFVARASQKQVEVGRFSAALRTLWIGPLLFGLSTAIPTAIAVFFGAPVVNWILEAVPVWVTEGLQVAGGILPVVGIAILLRYMPVKRYLIYLTIGFVLAAYLNMPILGIALLGFGFSYEFFRRTTAEPTPSAAAAASPQPQLAQTGLDYDE
ncbi:PTS mannose/fructose/sorbose/N-acetylgalactosamine transporter subunit IIC [Corynebacterium pacaense]|uniref:PTS mannose/fructose/sorbose/N-acetylgalactosamine transporter subunit IIC n=1 Tax=Corynebacterium pacaense TaxID=1816684 RepID=UPI0009BBA879|nr:PTS sugar transporter subunit IIC [Corynebacterium pacaense]